MEFVFKILRRISSGLSFNGSILTLKPSTNPLYISSHKSIIHWSAPLLYNPSITLSKKASIFFVLLNLVKIKNREPWILLRSVENVLEISYKVLVNYWARSPIFYWLITTTTFKLLHNLKASTIESELAISTSAPLVSSFPGESQRRILPLKYLY